MFNRKHTTIAILTAAILASPALAQCGASTAKATKTATNNDIVAVAQSAGQFNTLLTAAKAAGLAEALQGDGPLTVFAPTDAAFAKLPKGTVENLLKPENRPQLQAILKYHVIAGKLDARHVVASTGATTLNGQRVDFKTDSGTAMIDNARIVKTDIRASNGLIHVIDSVILPSSDNIVSTAKGAEKFNTLLTAAQRAGLVEVLSNGGPFTVFAPTDEAFEKLPAGTVEDLLKPENRDQLAKILKFHVLRGRIYASDAISAGQADTLIGQKVNVAKGGGQVTVNGARVVMADLDASNGVIHVIDQVILPK